MEAITCATERARWREAVDPQVEGRLTTAIDELAQLPVLDATVLRVLDALDDADSTTADLVRVLEADPTFAANLLRYANSAARSHPIRARTIRQAVMLVGRRALRQLALETATYRFIEVAPGNNASRGELHLHALGVAGAAQAAAARLGAPTEVPHLAALLHDIGKLVLPLAFGEEACEAIAKRHPDGPERPLAERERLGVDHATAGALLAERWNLPEGVPEAIALHHGGPSGLSSPTSHVAAVQLANELHRLLHGGDPDHALIDVGLERCGVDATILDHVAPHALPHDAQPPAEGELMRAVVDREHLSQTDDLTGAANRRYWLQSARGALGADSRGAVVLCAVGNLAAVDTIHGQRVADTVLCEVTRVLGHHGRVGRISAERFAVWIDEAEVAVDEVVIAINDELAESLGTDDLASDIRVALGAATAGTDAVALDELIDIARGRVVIESLTRRGPAAGSTPRPAPGGTLASVAGTGSDVVTTAPHPRLVRGAAQAA
jgi:putative nucleotidyltransferase with HDIG domain